MKVSDILKDVIEKARQEGDVHPNGKWVWTKTPKGYDWRTIKSSDNSKATEAPKPKSISYKNDWPKVGDKVELKEKDGGTKGEVYDVSPSGKTFQLKDDYGNKSNKWYNVNDFKNATITRPEPKEEVEEKSVKPTKAILATEDEVKQIAKDNYKTGANVDFLYFLDKVKKIKLPKGFEKYFTDKYGAGREDLESFFEHYGKPSRKQTNSAIPKANTKKFLDNFNALIKMEEDLGIIGNEPKEYTRREKEEAIKSYKSLIKKTAEQQAKLTQKEYEDFIQTNDSTVEYSHEDTVEEFIENGLPFNYHD